MTDIAAYRELMEFQLLALGLEPGDVVADLGSGKGALPLVTVSFVSCATNSDADRSPSKTTASTAPPPGTPLAKVKLGMNDAQVRGVLGDPTDSNA